MLGTSVCNVSFSNITGTDIPYSWKANSTLTCLGKINGVNFSFKICGDGGTVVGTVAARTRSHGLKYRDRFHLKKIKLAILICSVMERYENYFLNAHLIAGVIKVLSIHVTRELRSF